MGRGLVTSWWCGRARVGAFVGLLLSLLAVQGCVTVAPYQRERLAKADMELARDGDTAAGEEHATAYREGSSGALGASGGGCGCN